AIFLWADLPYASTGRSRRRRPPLTLLLLLQLLVAALAAVALARPATPTDPPRHLALILDASASMQATDVAPSRFEAARTRALERRCLDRTSNERTPCGTRGGRGGRRRVGQPGDRRAQRAHGSQWPWPDRLRRNRERSGPRCTCATAAHRRRRRTRRAAGRHRRP